MKRRRQNKADLIIDLTALLDVIFIILFAVMIQVSQIGVTSDDDSFVPDASDNNDYVNNHLNKYVCAITSYCVFDKTDKRERKLVVTVDKNQVGTPIHLSKNNTQQQFEDYKSLLIKTINSKTDESDSMILLTLNYNDEKILYRDECEISKIFKEIKDEFKDRDVMIYIPDISIE